MTQTAAVVGTAQYFSPEQARGEQVDFRSDIYSTGCLFYELMTGKPPFTGDSPVSVAYQHVGEIPPAPSGVAPDVDPIFDPVVAKVLSKERDDRFQSAGAFATALENALNGIEFHEDQSAPSTYTLPIYGTHDNTEPGFAAQAAPMTTEHPVFTTHDEPVETTRHRSNRGLIVLLSLIAVVAVAIASFLVIRSIQADAEKRAPVAIPDVKNLSEDDASSLLRDATFNVRVEREFDEDIDENKASRTDPSSGTQVAKESTVTLYISEGSEQRVIPEDLANQSEAAARDALRQAGLEVGEVTREDSATIPTDWVIGTSPDLGSKVKAGTEVDLILSTGKVQVPDLAGKTPDEAEQILKDQGLEKLSLSASPDTEVTDEFAPGTIVSQTPSASGTMEQGGTITYVLAEAPEEPAPSETPSETPSESESSDESTASESPSETPSEKPSKTHKGKLPPPAKPGEGN